MKVLSRSACYLALLGCITAFVGLVLSPYLLYGVTDPDVVGIAKNVGEMAKIFSYISILLLFLAGMFTRCLSKQFGSIWLTASSILLSLLAIVFFVYGISIVDSGTTNKIVEGSFIAIGGLGLAFCGGVLNEFPRELSNPPERVKG
jgi:peptidoglycan/LPS O-acetylase OafA/YrhL